MPTLKVVTYRIADALTGKAIEGGFMTEKFAESRLDKVRRKHPAAFVERVEA
jgi:hypothetical protein